jgi:hypothetical protein
VASEQDVEGRQEPERPETEQRDPEVAAEQRDAPPRGAAVGPATAERALRERQ